MVFLFINSGEDFDKTWTFIDEGEVAVPVLLDLEGTMGDSYSWGDDGAYAPYPRHLVLDRDHTITWMSRRYDSEALKEAVDAVVE